MNVYANIGTGISLPPNVDNPPGWATYRWIEIQTPIDLKESSEVTIQILLPAGLTNPVLAGNYKLIAWTNKEPVAIDSEIFTIGDAILNVTIPPSYPKSYQWVITSFNEYDIRYFPRRNQASRNN
jgi:hypothetical protein